MQKLDSDSTVLRDDAPGYKGQDCCHLSPGHARVPEPMALATPRANKPPVHVDRFCDAVVVQRSVSSENASQAPRDGESVLLVGLHGGVTLEVYNVVQQVLQASAPYEALKTHCRW